MDLSPRKYLGRRVVPSVGPFAPCPFGHLDLGNGFALPPDLLLAEAERACPSRVQVTRHMAHLVRSALKWRHPAGDEGAHQVGATEALRDQGLDSGFHHLDLGVALAGLLPVLPSRNADSERRQPDEVSFSTIRHVEECLLPLAAGFEPLDPGESGAGLRLDGGRPALQQHLLGSLLGRIRDGHAPEVVEAVPGVGGGPETAVAFGEGRPA